MSNKEKQALIAEVVALLQTRLTAMEQSQTSTQTPPQVSQVPEMLTIKECAEEIKGLSEHTVRQLVKQEKLPHIRTGAGQNGKILVSKSALLAYFGGA